MRQKVCVMGRCENKKLGGGRASGKVEGSVEEVKGSKIM